MIKTKAIGYVRVSSADQVENGVSLDAQRAKLAAYGEIADLEFVEIIADEGISAKRLDTRPGLQRALAMLEDGAAAALVVVKLDRLSRSTRDVLELADRSGREGWTLHSLNEKLDTGSAAGRFVLTVLGALAEMERAQIGERTKAALSHIRASGRKTGGDCPFGFDALEGGRLVPNPDEARVVETMRELRAAGLSFRKIADELSSRGVPAKRGGKWAAMTVSRVIAGA